MALRPQCNRIAISFNDEAMYAMAIADAAIDKRINPREPIFINPAKEITDNQESIKGNEFATDPANRSTIISQDKDIPFTVDAGLSTLGWCLALIFGGITTTSVDNPGPPIITAYRHIFRMADLCVSDQFPSTSMIIGFIGDVMSNQLVKGVILNELRIALSEPGILEVSGTLFTDGTSTTKQAFSFPDQDLNVASEFLNHSQADFLTANVGDPLVSKKALFRGFELTINNNLDRDDARSQLTQSSVTLNELRTGNREVTLSVSVAGHQGDEFWRDNEMNVAKDVQLRIAKDEPTATGLGGRLLDIRARNTIIQNIEDIGFDGIRDRYRIVYKLYAADAGDYQAGLTGVTPIFIELRNGDDTYFTVTA